MIQAFEDAAWKAPVEFGGMEMSDNRAGLVAVLAIVERDAHPRRGDEVERWIKRARDSCFSAIGAGPGWYALDDLLDDYRLHADVGAALSVPAEEIGPHDA